MMVKLKLLVLRCRDIEVTRQFYEHLLKIQFTLEKHDQGLEHYVSVLNDQLVWELYPTKNQPDNTRLGFKLENCQSSYIIKDPDGRFVEIS
jgi:hypothetical protein